MKRTYSLRRNTLLTSTGLKLGVGLIAALIVLTLLRLVLPGAFLAVMSPFLHASSWMGARVSTFTSGFSDAATLAKERDALADENIILAQENATLTAQIADLNALDTAPPGIRAGVLARPPEAPYDTLIVAAGSDAGVRVGDRVLAGGAVPIGTVAAVTGSAARVELYSAPGATESGWVGEHRLPITLMGVGGGAFAASAPRVASTSVGNLVYVAAGGAVPVGTVGAIGGDSASPLVQLAIKSSVNLFSLTFVVIEHAPVTP